MARSITLTLGVGLGADLGPNFNLTADVGSVTPSTATKIDLLSPGKVVSVDDLATQVTVTSTGTCTNSITQNIPCVTGTTSTTTTTTAAPAGSFIVKNTSGSGQIDDVVTTGGAYFYFFISGAFPVTTGQQADAGGASLTGADIFVDISNYSSTSCLSLYINGALSGQLEVSANGTYTFTNKTFTTSDTVLIEYVSGICP